MSNEHYKILVTGCGRSGTKYIASVLQSMGLDVPHEDLGKDGAASWCMAVDSVEAPWGRGRRGATFDAIFHQVRHPLKVIPSLSTFTPPSWEFIEKYIPCPASDPTILRAAKYYYYWNLEAEKIAQWRYQVEEFPEVFDEFCRRINMPVRREVLAENSTMINSRKTRPGMGLVRRVLDKFGIGQRSPIQNILYNQKASYTGDEFTWEKLEEAAPGWSGRIREMSQRYGYTADDDAIAMQRGEAA